MAVMAGVTAVGGGGGTVSQSEGLGQTNNHNQHNKGL